MCLGNEAASPYRSDNRGAEGDPGLLSNDFKVWIHPPGVNYAKLTMVTALH